jgi:DNA-binding phage protein
MSDVAAELGLERANLYRKMRQLGIRRDRLTTTLDVQRQSALRWQLRETKQSGSR